MHPAYASKRLRRVVAYESTVYASVGLEPRKEAPFALNYQPVQIQVRVVLDELSARDRRNGGPHCEQLEWVSQALICEGLGGSYELAEMKP